MNDAARVSRLTWMAQEWLDMYGDLLEDLCKERDPAVDGVVAEIRAYRAEQGWTPNGYGGELDKATSPR